MIEFLKTKGLAILGAFLVLSISLFSVIQRPSADTIYEKLIVTSESYTSPYFSAGNGYQLYFDNETPISVYWLMDNPDYSVTVGASHNSMTIDFGNGYKLTSINGRTLNSELFKEWLELEPTRWEGITKSRTAITLISEERDIFITAQSEGEALSVFQKILKFVVSIGESLFSLAGTTVTFIVNHPIALLGLLIGLIYTGILIFRLITKGV